MHVMNALKGAGLFNSYKLCTSLWIMIPPLHATAGFNLQSTAEIPRLRSGEHRRPADTERG